jgi:hypothetical protein
MASNMPLPVPPRTPTPPPDDDAPGPVGLGLDGDLAPAMAFDSNALSPMSATFPSKQYATLGPNDSVSQRATPTTIYTPASATFPHTPATVASGTNDTDSSENVRNPFNFQPVTYAPGRPQANKSVCSLHQVCRFGSNNSRMSAAAEDTSTSIAVFPTRSSWNPPRALPSSSRHLCQFLPSKNTAPPCPRTKSCA